MNRNQFILLLVLVIAVGGTAWLHYRRQASGWSGQSPELGQKLLGNFPVNDVARIRIKQGTNELVLTRTNGIWCVEQRDNYPANFGQISQLLLKLRDLKIVQTEEVGLLRLPRLNLAAPGRGANTATLLAFDDAAGKPIRTLWLGKQHREQDTQPSPGAPESGWPDGRYVLLTPGSTLVAVISDPLTEISPTPDSWLDKTFFQIDKPWTISVSYPQSSNSWMLVRETETNRWKLASLQPGEVPDDTKLTETADSFSAPSFVDVVTNARPGPMGLDRPTRVEIKTFDGFDYALRIGQETNDNYYVAVHTSATLPTQPAASGNEKTNMASPAASAPSAEPEELQRKLAQESALNRWVYLVPAWTVNPLLKTRREFLASKPATTETNTPATVTRPKTG